MLRYYTGDRKGKATHTHLGKGKTPMVIKRGEDTALASPAAMKDKRYTRDPCKTKVSTVWIICNG